jgi:hypothetical protein
MVCSFEPARHFAALELSAGRLPTWIPYQFAGAPFIWPKFSPFCFLQCCTRSPIVLAWTQLLEALVAGIGVYVFSRRVLGVSFWPATLGGWCYPLTGFFIFWQGYPSSQSIVWLPWIMLAVYKTAQGPKPLAPVGLAVATYLVLTSGHLDIAGQVLLASGVFAIWCVMDAYRRDWFRRQARRVILALAIGWAFGFLLAAPAILPMVEYAQTGARIARRGAGSEERPPSGLAALPQIVLPDMYGQSIRVVKGNILESSAAAYTGLLATLLLAPLAWCSRRHRSIGNFGAFLALLGLSWTLNIPGFVNLFRLPGLNMMSHNRLVFVASFAILALSVIGLEVLLSGPIAKRGWSWMPLGILVALFAWCIFRMAVLPDLLEPRLGQAVESGPLANIHDPEQVLNVQSWFVSHYAAAAVWCALAIGGWWLIWSGRARQLWLLPTLGAFMWGDLLWFGYGRSPQCDPALYYPRIPILDQIAKSVPGRIIGFKCLPANLASMCGLRDVRGYDGVDPERLLDLMEIAATPGSMKLRYARMLWASPKIYPTAEGDIRLSPVLDALAVRYVICRGDPVPGTRPAFQAPDYWVVENRAALPRAYIPRRVEVVPDKNLRLRKLASPGFDPRELAFVETPVELPTSCQGAVDISEEVPTRITISARMETPGLLVLADLWDKGWHAYKDGVRLTVLRANHAVRGVVLPAGPTKLVFRYEPASLAWGLRIAGLAALGLIVWMGILGRRHYSARQVH